MLVRLMYASRAGEAVNAEALAAILKRSKDNNAKAGVTGVLCFCTNARIFLQVLEGGRLPVSQLYNRIANDPRHHDVALLRYEEIGERRFAGWSMGQVNMARLNPGLILKYSELGSLDPWSVPGAATGALLDEMIATAAIMGQP